MLEVTWRTSGVFESIRYAEEGELKYREPESDYFAQATVQFKNLGTSYIDVPGQAAVKFREGGETYRPTTRLKGISDDQIREESILTLGYAPARQYTPRISPDSSSSLYCLVDVPSWDSPVLKFRDEPEKVRPSGWA